MRASIGTKEEPSGLVVFGFALTLWPLTIAQLSLNFVAPYYSLSYGLGLAFIGMVLTLGRSLDVVADVAVAWGSDRTRTRWGRRKPWIVGGLVLYVPAALLLFLPPANVTATRYVVTVMLFLLSWTIAFIPYLSQGTELSADAAVKNRINIVQSAVGLVALIAAFSVPLLLIDPRAADARAALADLVGGVLPEHWAAYLRAPSVTGAEYYRRSMLVMTTLALAPLLVTLPIYLLRVRERPVPTAQRAGRVTSALRNPVFMRFAAGYVLIMIAHMGRGGLFPFILAFGLRIPDSYLFYMMLLFTSSLVVTPVWSWLLKRLERTHCIMLAAAVEAIGLVMLFFAPAENAFFTGLAFIVVGLPGQTLLMVPYLIAADAADYSLWRTGAESRALHINLCSLIVKLGAVFAGVSVWLAGTFGFDPRVAEQPAHVILLIKLIGLGVPVVCLIAGILVIAGFPLNQRRHAAIQRRLERALAP